jgi:hypothetical protein
MTDPYRPDIGAFCDILRDYSRYGLSYFKDQTRDMQQRMRTVLAGGLEDNDDQIEAKLAAIKKGGQSQLRFLPMPRPGGTDFKASFFLPRIVRSGDGTYASHSLLCFGSKRKWVRR